MNPKTLGEFKTNLSVDEDLTVQADEGLISLTLTAACLPPIRRIPFKKNTCFAGARIQPTNQSGAPENQSKQPPKDVASSLPHSTTFACEVV